MRKSLAIYRDKDMYSYEIQQALDWYNSSNVVGDQNQLLLLDDDDEFDEFSLESMEIDHDPVPVVPPPCPVPDDGQEMTWDVFSTAFSRDTGYPSDHPDWDSDESHECHGVEFALPHHQSRIVRVVEHFLKTNTTRMTSVHRLAPENDPLNISGLRVRRSGRRKQKTYPTSVYHVHSDGITRYRLVATETSIKLKGNSVTTVPTHSFHVTNSDFNFRITLKDRDDLNTLVQLWNQGAYDASIKWRKADKCHLKSCIVGPDKAYGYALKSTSPRVFALGRVSLVDYNYVFFYSHDLYF